MPTQGQPSPAQPSPAQAAAMAAVARSTKLTGRAALLAVVICAIALSLAYPVREYIAQRQQIDQLLAQQQTMAAQVKALQAEATKLSQTWYIEQEARGPAAHVLPAGAVLPGGLRPAREGVRRQAAGGGRPLVREALGIGAEGRRHAR